MIKFEDTPWCEQCGKRVQRVCFFEDVWTKRARVRFECHGKTEDLILNQRELLTQDWVPPKTVFAVDYKGTEIHGG